MDIKDLRKKLLNNPEFRKEYFKINIPFEMSKRIMSARIKRGITQAQLAKKINTGQSSIARIEKGNAIPTLGLLQKIAEALNMLLVLPSLRPMEEFIVSINSQGVGLTDLSFASEEESYTTIDNINFKVRKAACFVKEAQL